MPKAPQPIPIPRLHISPPTNCLQRDCYRRMCLIYMDNTDERNYRILLQTLKSRLIRRHYHPHFIDNCTAKSKCTHYHRYLQASQPKHITAKPFFKCLPPPQFRNFKLNKYDKIQGTNWQASSHQLLTQNFETRNSTCRSDTHQRTICWHCMYQF